MNFASPQGEGFPPSPEVDTNLKTPTKTAKIAADTCARAEGLKGVRGMPKPLKVAPGASCGDLGENLSTDPCDPVQFSTHKPIDFQ